MSGELVDYRPMKMLLAVVCAVVSAAALCAPGAADCFAVVVGKDASADGAVLVGHNEQNSGRRFLNLRKVRFRTCSAA